jgi:hypothetical protein
VGLGAPGAGPRQLPRGEQAEPQRTLSEAELLEAEFEELERGEHDGGS